MYITTKNGVVNTFCTTNFSFACKRCAPLLRIEFHPTQPRSVRHDGRHLHGIIGMAPSIGPCQHSTDVSVAPYHHDADNVVNDITVGGTET